MAGLLNPDFEVDLSNWTEQEISAVAASMTPTRDTGTFHSGVASLKMVQTTTGEDDFMEQTVAKAPGTYVVTAWMHCPTFVGAAVNNRGLMVYSNPSFGFVDEASGAITGATSSWKFLQAVVKIDQRLSDTGIGIRLYAPNSTIFWDDISVNPVLPLRRPILEMLTQQDRKKRALALQMIRVKPPAAASGTTFNQALDAVVATLATIQNQVNKILSVTVATTATIQRQVNKTLSVTVATLGSIQRQINKTLTVTVATTATLAALKVINVALTATVATTATIVRTVQKILSVTTATTGTLVRQTNKTMAVTTATTATVQKQINKPLVVTVATTATLGALKVIVKVLTATVSTTASLVTSFIQGVLGLIFSPTVPDPPSGLNFPPTHEDEIP